MKLIVGLGNPGPKYETTRHNAGFLAIDFLVDEWKATGPQDVGGGETWQATVGGEKILLAKPLTYMKGYLEAMEARDAITRAARLKAHAESLEVTP